MCFPLLFRGLRASAQYLAIGSTNFSHQGSRPKNVNSAAASPPYPSASHLLFRFDNYLAISCPYIINVISFTKMGSSKPSKWLPLRNLSIPYYSSDYIPEEIESDNLKLLALVYRTRHFSYRRAVLIRYPFSL